MNVSAFRPQILLIFPLWTFHLYVHWDNSISIAKLILSCRFLIGIWWIIRRFHNFFVWWQWTWLWWVWTRGTCVWRRLLTVSWIFGQNRWLSQKISWLNMRMDLMAQDGRPFKVSCLSFIEIFLLINLILELNIYFDTRQTLQSHLINVYVIWTCLSQTLV
jgi:hypothetical protein